MQLLCRYCDQPCIANLCGIPLSCASGTTLRCGVGETEECRDSCRVFSAEAKSMHELAAKFALRPRCERNGGVMHANILEKRLVV
jgi:hypothetical protein